MFGPRRVRARAAPISNARRRLCFGNPSPPPSCASNQRSRCRDVRRRDDEQNQPFDRPRTQRASSRLLLATRSNDGVERSPDPEGQKLPFAGPHNCQILRWWCTHEPESLPCVSSLIPFPTVGSLTCATPGLFYPL